MADGEAAGVGAAVHHVRRRNSKRRLVQSWRGIHGLLDASIGGGGVERWESGHGAILFFLCSQASSPGRDVHRARSKPRMGEKPSITCKKSAIEFGLSVLLAFNFIRYEILCIFF